MSDDASFLKFLAEEILNDNRPQKRVVLPNKRSLFVLRELLPEQINLETIDDYMQRLSQRRMMDTDELIVVFYLVYSKLENNPQSFDVFVRWAHIFLSDINEIDLYLSDISKIYDHINEFHQTGSGFNDGNVGGLEADYMTFWSRLPTYYEELRKELDRLDFGYRGLVYRLVSEMTVTHSQELASTIGDEHLYWVGIVPGNPSELKLLEWLHQRDQVSLFADRDSYYVNDPIHEAGRLFREHSLKLPLNEPTNLLETKSMVINEHPVPGKLAIALQVKHVLDQIPRSEWDATLIVVSDNDLFIPLTEVLLEYEDHINITSGYPLRNTEIHRFVMSWLNLHASAITMGNELAFHHRSLEEFLDIPLIRRWLKDAVDFSPLHRRILSKNYKFVPISWVSEVMQSNLFAQELFELLLDWQIDGEQPLERINRALLGWKKQPGLLSNELERKALSTYQNRLELLISRFLEVLPENNLRSLKSFLHRHMGFGQFYVEQPENSAIQMMNMLETRMLDFNHVIIAGASEGHLPPRVAFNTHIPYVHRIHFGLPNINDTQALHAYHFYRLLHRSRTLDLIYSTSSEGIEVGEPSRYILQLQHELSRRNKDISLQRSEWSIAFDGMNNQVAEIEKTPEITEHVKETIQRKLSASAINSFVNSPLEFYYYYILNLDEQNEVEEDIKASTFGSIVHEAIEEIYAPFDGKIIDIKELGKSLQTSDDLVEKCFMDRFGELEASSGRNLIAKEVSKSYVKTFVRFDLREMREHGPVKLLGREQHLGGEVEVKGLSIRLTGFADRIDERNGIVRIVDYKTGLVNQNELGFNLDKLGHNPKASKALQLALYKYLFLLRSGLKVDRVESCIYSFRNTTAGYLYLKDASKESFKEDFEQVLSTVVQEMIDPDEPFAHRSHSEYTTF